MPFHVQPSERWFQTGSVPDTRLPLEHSSALRLLKLW